MYVKVHVTPGAKRESVKKINAENFKILVKEKPEHNLANKRAIRMLAAALGVLPNHLRIIHGHQTPHKIVHIRPGGLK
jgi:uncharacterized protein YggU (UPF0235/DUF167 family)